MRSPRRTGDEWPPGSGSRQSRFFDGPNSVGTLVAVEMPEPFGPRNRDQSGSALAASDAPSVTGTEERGERPNTH